MGTFNQSLQCTQDVFVGFQAPLPPVSEANAIKHLIAKLNSDILQAYNEGTNDHVPVAIPQPGKEELVIQALFNTQGMIRATSPVGGF